MTPPTERRQNIDATNAPSAGSGVDETAPAGASQVGTAVPGFGPPAAAGEGRRLGIMYRRLGAQPFGELYKLDLKAA